MPFIESLNNAFVENSNPENAFSMANYMRNHFIFFGIKTNDRREILKKIWSGNQIEVSENSRKIALALFKFPEREFHYCAIEILIKILKSKYKKDDIQLIEFLITTHSWWDSVDTISKYILGQYLLEFPSETTKVVERFSNSENIWFNRSSLLFQLGYKQKTNFELLQSLCEKHKHSEEFFIQKAIGWALREYAKTNPAEVIQYVNTSNLKKLSQKEAKKHFL
jgi:3-methyladenine DNA glycosylase AlkD